ncbi:unnamed protein product [Moneuplotes crassus]|uniref:Uncharacterized protein n=1 Tax=Euplotes crassus TaxID=5936 RepID=A0AAD1X7J0_EUPCR|nr:unnamed protein product [Moneuplotes crassus]
MESRFDYMEYFYLLDCSEIQSSIPDRETLICVNTQKCSHWFLIIRINTEFLGVIDIS